MEAIEQFWSAMSAGYPGFWSKHYGTLYGADGELTNPGKLWASALGNIQPAAALALAQALIRRQPTFAPSVGEIERALPDIAEAVGLPSIDAAYMQALQAQYRHPAVYAAVRSCDAFALRNEPSDKAKRRWLKAYAPIVQRAACGEVFRWPKDVLADKSAPKRVPPEKAEAELARLRNRFGRASA